jgi:hypothetical protein
MLRVVIKTTSGGFMLASVDAPPQLEVTDLADTPAPADAAADAILAERAQPFDLAAAPPIRARVLRLQEGFHVLLITGHHIAVDGWSFDVIARDAAHLLHRRLDPSVPALPPLAADFLDHAREESRWLATAEAEASLTVWRERLGPRPAAPPLSDRISSAERRLGAEATRQLVALAGRLGVSLFATLLGCIQALMLLLERDHRPRVATLVANREAPGSEDLVGLFVDTRVVVGEPDPDLQFGRWLEQAAADAVKALHQQPVPFAWLAERLRDQAPLFDTLFVFNQPTAVSMTADLTGFGVEFEALEVSDGRFLPGAPTNLGAILTASLNGDALHVSLRLADNRLTGEAADTLVALELLVARGTADPDRRLRELAE